MYAINQNELSQVSGGCSDNTCQLIALDLLESCSYEQLRLINGIFKNVVLSDALAGADEATIKKALIEAMKNSSL